MMRGWSSAAMMCVALGALTACGPEPLVDPATPGEPTEDMGATWRPDDGSPDPSPDMSEPVVEPDDGGTSPGGFCQGRADRSHCDEDVSVRCQAGAEAGRTPCVEGCDVISGQCREPMEPMGPCGGEPDGATLCDEDDQITCQGGAETARTSCPAGCEAGQCKDEDFCVGKLEGLWCFGDELVDCQDDQITNPQQCAFGCESMELGTPDRCRQRSCTEFTGQGDCETWEACQWYECRGVCRPAGTPEEIVCNQSSGQLPPTPPTASPSPPDGKCNHMDWELSPDGWYLVSRFGTDGDDTTQGRSTTCKFLQDQYRLPGVPLHDADQQLPR